MVPRGSRPSVSEAMSVTVERAVPARLAGGRIERLGLAMRCHRVAIQAVQWTVVLFYVVLVAVPAFLPLPAADAHLWGSLTRLARFIFWGIWWPFVILSIMVLGRVWCGVFCPEGALSEWVSRYGAGRGIPRWMKWGGWPFVAFLGTTVFGQMTSVYDYPKPALLILGGSTAAAMVVGLLYGRGKRVWCRHLCPVSGVFALLAKVSPLHFRTDQSAWDAAPVGHRTSRAHSVNCAPLINIRRLDGSSACHMCGRCAGERDAVALAWRPPGVEIFKTGTEDSQSHIREAAKWPARLLVFGMLGVALGAFQWSASPWFVSAKLVVAGWLIGHNVMWPLHDPGHWWLLTHYPQADDVFSWLDGAMLLAYIGTEALIVGSWIVGWMRLIETLTGIAWQRFVQVLIPYAGASLFVGLSFLTSSQLAGEGVRLPWADAARTALLVAVALWSVVLAVRLAPRHRAAAAAATLLAVALPLAAWAVQFFLW